jgi:hypothetical protein
MTGRVPAGAHRSARRLRDQDRAHSRRRGSPASRAPRFSLVEPAAILAPGGLWGTTNPRFCAGRRSALVAGARLCGRRAGFAGWRLAEGPVLFSAAGRSLRRSTGSKVREVGVPARRALSSTGPALTDVMVTKVRAACRVTGCRPSRRPDLSERRQRPPDPAERATELIFGSPCSHLGWLPSAPDPVQADLSAWRAARVRRPRLGWKSAQAGRRWRLR